MGKILELLEDAEMLVYIGFAFAAVSLGLVAWVLNPRIKGKR